MRTLITHLFFFSLITVSGSVALANPPTIDEHGDVWGLEFLYGHFNNPLVSTPSDESSTAIGVTPYAEFYVSDGLILGGKLPIAHLRFNDDSDSTLGNVTGILRFHLGHSPASLGLLTTSISFPTADDENDGGLVASAFAYFWIPDPGLYLPNTTTFRISYNHQVFLRSADVEFELGLQFLSIEGQDNRLRVPFRVAGSKYLNTAVSLIGRFGTYWEIDAPSGTDDFLHILDAGLRIFAVGNGVLDATIYFPLDDRYRDTVELIGGKIEYRANF